MCRPKTRVMIQREIEKQKKSHRKDKQYTWFSLWPVYIYIYIYLFILSNENF